MIRQKTYLRLFAVLAIGMLVADRAAAQPTKSPQIVQLFREVVAKPSRSTVSVIVDDKEVALGTIVSADGWILTKHSEIKGDKIVCRLHDGTEVDAELVNFNVPFDLAMLKVEASGLTPVVWTDSKASRVGHWVASAGTGKDPVAIGIISVAARAVKGKYIPATKPAATYLGVHFDPGFAGVKVDQVLPSTPAEKAGLQTGDHILALNGKEVESIADLQALLSKNKPGDEVKLKIHRDDKEQELKAKLGTPPGGKGGRLRGEVQNNMGSKLSDRISGFPVILQHDSVIRPNECGGPLVNLDGQVLGINIARAGRTESYAIPSEAIRPLLDKLKRVKKEKK